MGDEKLKIEELIQNSGLNSKNILYNEPMSKHTSFKVGGPAECYIKAESEEEVKKVLEISSLNNIPLVVTGRGTNLLVKDNGVSGIVLNIEIKKIKVDEDEISMKREFRDIKTEIRNIKEDLEEHQENINIKVGAGNTIFETAQELMNREISGFEELAGIPGTIGGAIRMNAGAHGKEFKDIVNKITAVDYNGNICEFTNQEAHFEYRNSIFSKGKYIILEAELELKKGKKEEIQKKMLEYTIWRKEHQPLEYPSAGSTFKRGVDFITAKLIDECGLKGYKIGGAQISTKHAGFIINTGNATANDILELIKYIEKKVYEKFNKKIELEVEIIGE